VSERDGAGPTALPRVTVIVATRDREELLRRTLAAIDAQDYAGVVETVVVYDSSAPDPALAVDGGPRPVRVVTNTRTPGLAGARNSGILASSSPFIAFCDDDDTWLPDKLSRQVPRMLARDALTGVSGIIVCFGEREIVRVPRACDVTLAGLSRRRVTEAHPSTVVVRREALLGPVGLVDEEIPGSYGEDYDWLLRAVAAGGVDVLEEPTARVLWSRTHSYFSRRWALIIAAIDYLLAKHPVLATNRRGLAGHYARKAFGYAALGQRRQALAWAVRAVRLSPRELRAYLAVLVATGLVGAERLQQLAHTRGKGI
jgi:glycosyltransferase involved in cell wall biosynthesis